LLLGSDRLHMTRGNPDFLMYYLHASFAVTQEFLEKPLSGTKASGLDV